jgi:hypothetical protein
LKTERLGLMVYACNSRRLGASQLGQSLDKNVSENHCLNNTRYAGSINRKNVAQVSGKNVKSYSKTSYKRECGPKFKHQYSRKEGRKEGEKGGRKDREREEEGEQRRKEGMEGGREGGKKEKKRKRKKGVERKEKEKQAGK